ncbi:DeoR/GlpR family DNA-binding transcription regulator [Alicyclobacillus dauci]|uniref:DeoR/GlpR family DNA-binding transcription regulator n=1 Tax=Alicyclobacillus dauci TaxID=1475485 RepID=A0ABY6Z5E8_9BACL|nr:DeoR/GlpR family DNA-binding transcription regulator [Alicyclobacillus dauci]WAH38042.1 DeoR/GlpR family DNA-binding transcription regulator [Alicyclobacillus dauci]
MLGEVRQQKVVEMLIHQKSVRIGELSEFFDVSEETIRRDLKKLESDGLLKRTHGGAVINDEVDVVPSYILRSQQNIMEKRKIAALAADLVPDDGTVMLDGGSTTLEIVKNLANRRVTVITSDLYIALEASKSLHLQLIVLGGMQQKGTSALIGPECVERVRGYNVDVVFLGTGGLGARQGLTTASSAEAEVKRAMMKAGERVYCVADASKFGRAALVSYAAINDVKAIITDAPQDNQIVQDMQEAGATFHFA